ncbi:TIGR04283 family arsenosugar biosynthesis glycosyltransferase [Zooshikella harenae]|uniref:TIGR04283 family arsenosugar biosynthesis glycosyltransferase n=1 Tax=Zooshikella harenae TaxID=2827238 RepID=A0ABS5ZFF3_9GAMM|nr:TIGR04283 family arsenosugar biosynthesis glycosyltransferase [Zooshikella harenae]MBU2712705.1 TIGR04283 family arsenosugar biosynthesis glycosyltransferase [Zooshikella harenae]
MRERVPVKLSIIVPTLNEAKGIQPFLMTLQPLRSKGHEVILVDGGSQDKTTDYARTMVDCLVSCATGRARQMQYGAELATGEVLLFLHADTLLPDQADEFIEQAFGKGGRCWGRFDVSFSGSHWLFYCIAYMMNKRSRITGIATGDQAIFVKRDHFEAIGGFLAIPLMEDIDLCSRLRQQGKPVCIPVPVITSSRRWEQNGIFRTILLMWWIRCCFYFGTAPEKLWRKYYMRDSN